MARENEFQQYSVEQLESKANRYKKIQLGMMLMSVVFAAIIAAVTYAKNSENGYQIIPILLLVGIVYPLLTFGNMRKKILKEIGNRKA